MSIFKELGNVISNILKLIVVLLFLLSLFYFTRSVNLLDIDKYAVKDGVFNLNNQDLIYNFKKLSGRRHKVCLKFFMHVTNFVFDFCILVPQWAIGRATDRGSIERLARWTHADEARALSTHFC